MKKLKINKMAILVLFACIVTAFSFLKSSAVSSQKNEIKTNPDTKYQITYELNGGRFEGEYPKTFKISQETAIPNPIKDGSEFLGWTINDKTDVSPAKDYKIPSMTKEDVKLTANWKSKKSVLVDGKTFNDIFRANFTTATEIQFIKGTPNSNGEDVSQARDKSIMAYLDGKILKVTCKDEIFANQDSSKMFANLDNIQTIKFENFNTDKVTNMSSMFRACSSLKEIVGLENWDTSQVTDMNGMLDYCNNLSGSITISNPHITSYTDMFTYCSTKPNTKFIVKYISPETKEVARKMVATKYDGITVGNVILYEVSTLVNGKLFNNSIKTLRGFEDVTEIVFDQGVYNGSDIVDVSEAQDESIKAFILGKSLFIASENEIVANPDSSYMFNNLKNITNIDFSFNFNTDNVTNMRGMFEGSSKLIEIVGLEKWDTSQVTNMSYMFNGCISLTSLDVSDFNTSKVTDMNSMFFNCKSLTSLDLSKWDTSQVTNMSNMFYSCDKLSGSITIMNPNITSYSYMFSNCSTVSPAKFVVNYTSGYQSVAKAMVNTKSSTSNVVLGTEVGTINDIPNKEEPSVPDTVVLTIKDGSNTTTKEIVAGEIGSLNIPSKEGMAFSGYFYDAEFTKPVSERDIISEDTTIYVKWEEVPQVEEIPQEENKDESLGEVA